MILSEVIFRLNELLKEEGDIELKFDCPFCYRTTIPDKIVKIKKYVQLEK